MTGDDCYSRHHMTVLGNPFVAAPISLSAPLLLFVRIRIHPISRRPPQALSGREVRRSRVQVSEFLISPLASHGQTYPLMCKMHPILGPTSVQRPTHPGNELRRYGTQSCVIPK